MLIKVRYHDNACGIIHESLLEKMIMSDEILAFRRSEGWAIIGRDRLRERIAERRRKGCLINIYI